MSFGVAIDFDGVLADSEMEPLPGAREMVTRLVKSGCECWIFSARACYGGGVAQIRAWLDHHGFPEMDVVPKPRADVYLDDRAIRFDEWSTAYAAIVRLKGRQS